jgi:hypothetical protein
MGKLTLGALATSKLEIVPFREYALFSERQQFLKACCKSCSAPHDSA